MSTELRYQSFQCKIFLGERLANGEPGPLLWVGDNSQCQFGAEPQTEEFKENWSGNRGVALVLDQGTDATLSLNLLQANNRNLMIATGGEEVTQDVDAVVGRVIAATLPEVGQHLLLRALKVSALTITDSTPTTPKTLTKDVNYREDLAAGSVEILDATTDGPFVPPLLANFTPGELKYIKLLSKTDREFWVRAVGVNTAKAGRPRFVADWYRWKPTPASLDLISESRTEIPLTGSVLQDDTKEFDAELGYFGRIAYLS